MSGVIVHGDCGHTIEAEWVSDPCPHCGRGLFDLVVVYSQAPLPAQVLVLECCACGATIAPDSVPA